MSVDREADYYQILHIQTDAPAAVAKASYRALMQKLKAHPDLGGDCGHASLLNEAYGVICDPVKRAEYDRRRTEPDFTQAADTGAGAPAYSPASRPAPASASAKVLALAGANLAAGAGQYPAQRSQLDGCSKHVFAAAPRRVLNCAFCGHPQPVVPTLKRGESVAVEHCLNETCANCESPVLVPGGDALSQGQRGGHRVRKGDGVHFFTHWPQLHGHRGQVADLSPSGLGFHSALRIKSGSVVKLDSALLQGVVKILHCRELEQGGLPGFQLGGKFLTLRFGRQVGNFISHHI